MVAAIRVLILVLLFTLQYILVLFQFHELTSNRIGVGSAGHLFSSGSPVQTQILAILKILVKNLKIVYVPF